MEDRDRKRQRKLALTRDFECSRLEDRLLAAAYERVVPPIRRPIKRHLNSAPAGATLNEKGRLGPKVSYAVALGG